MPVNSCDKGHHGAAKWILWVVSFEMPTCNSLTG